MIGKVTPDDLRDHVFTKTGAHDESVLVGPAYGEDTAAIDLGDRTLVVNSDPISLATKRIGTLGVYVACNDVAASGADPRWLTVVVFLHDDDPTLLDEITDQLDEAAQATGVAIVGGHSEYAPERSRPLLSLTCLGLTDRYIPTGGAEVGDTVIITKGAAIEGTAILATDFEDELRGAVSDAVLDRAAGFFDEISVVAESRIVRDRATALHDPTEGGLIDGLLELAAASGVGLDIDRDSIPIRPETSELCDAMGIDPLRIFGSGALLLTVASEDSDGVLSDLHDAGIEAAAIGTVEAAEDPVVTLGGEDYRSPVRDDLYALWE